MWPQTSLLLLFFTTPFSWRLADSLPLALYEYDCNQKQGEHSFFYIKKQQKTPVPNGFKSESLPWAYCDIAMQSENKVKKAALV